MVICYVKNCKSRSIKGTTIRFFSMPKKKSLAHEWLKHCRPDTDQKSDARVCSKHFLPSDYHSKTSRKHDLLNESHLKYARLKEDAVPSLELDGDTESRSLEDSSITKIENGYLKNKVKALENKLIELERKENEQVEQNKHDVNQKIVKECCVPSCASNELKTIKSENSGITYNELPKDSQTKSRLVQSYRIGDWRPNADSVVCSPHFSDENVVQTERHALADDASGTCGPITELNADELAETNLCRICLSSDRKVDNIGDDDVAQQYEYLTSSKDCLGDILPQHICWECKARLASFARLRSVALRSLELLQEFYETGNNQETEDIQFIIDRDNNTIEIIEQPRKSTKMKNDDDNLGKRKKVSKSLKKGGKRTRMKYDYDKMATLTKISKATNEEEKNIEVENENDNSDLDNVNDNFENAAHVYFEHLKDENASQKSDDVNYNSDLEDVIYDSDNSKSDNKDSIMYRKVDLHLAKINCMFDDEKLSLISRGINSDCIQIKNGKNARDDKSIVYEEFEDMFSVKHLTKDEQLKEFLQRRDSDNYNNSGFKCDICFRGFLRKRIFELHQLKHTDAHGPLKCSLCGIHFRHSKLLFQHLKVTHQNRYMCKHCNYITGSLQKAKEHMLFHKGTIYKCEQCDKSFKTIMAFQCHFRKKHSWDVVCLMCGKSFASDRGLHTHKMMVHPHDSPEVPEDGPRCVECDIQFSTDTALTTHYQESNKHKHLYQDDKSRKRKAASVICELCGMELPNFLKYHFHFKSYHPDKARTQYPFSDCPVMCDVCGFVCPNQARLKMHKDTHSDIKKYSCGECGQRFKTMQSVYAHREVHKGVVNSCDVCGKVYVLASTLKRHKIIHQNRKYDCNICGKSFNHPQHRQNHITYVHLKKPLPERKNRVRVKS